MEHLTEMWSLVVVLLAAFIIGWAAEAAQTFIPQALALSILAWMQTLPEFAVEAVIAWNRQKDLMIANLTGSLRLLVGLGWPMIFFVHFFFQGVRKRTWIGEIVLNDSDFVGVLCLFVSILYFLFILVKGTLSCTDSIFLIIIYFVYLYFIVRFPPKEIEDPADLPWVARRIVRLNPAPKVVSVIGLFLIGGIALNFSIHPFIGTLQKWSVALGISTFVFVQWVAPFLSEFPEKVSAFNWARQPGKAPMAVMNMVSSNINQWTMLAAMIPLVFNLSLGHFEPLVFDRMHTQELALTIAQSALGGMVLLDLRLSLLEALLIFSLWLIQFLFASMRLEVTALYCLWITWEVFKLAFQYYREGRLPRALVALGQYRRHKSSQAR